MSSAEQDWLSELEHAAQREELVAQRKELTIHAHTSTSLYPLVASTLRLSYFLQLCGSLLSFMVLLRLNEALVTALFLFFPFFLFTHAILGDAQVCAAVLNIQH